MRKYNYTIRREASSYIEVIDQVAKAAFASAAHSSGTESFIIKALRANDQLTISLATAEEEGALVGHIAISPVMISLRSKGWFRLGPVSEIPSRKESGLGSGPGGSDLKLIPVCCICMLLQVISRYSLYR